MGTGVDGCPAGDSIVGEPGQIKPPVGLRVKCVVTLAGLANDGTAPVLGVEMAAIATEVATEVAPVGVNPVEIGEGKGLETNETRIGEAKGRMPA